MKKLKESIATVLCMRFLLVLATLGRSTPAAGTHVLSVVLRKGTCHPILEALRGSAARAGKRSCSGEKRAVDTSGNERAAPPMLRLLPLAVKTRPGGTPPMPAPQC